MQGIIESVSGTTIIVDGELLNPSDAYDQLFKSLGLQSIEVRRVTVGDYSSQVPEIVMSAMREVGADNIAIDLTNGLSLIHIWL